ncbi:MAG: hypothetical protein IPI52_06005 [Bacteroidetes bacterium]|nr:hypothetical protein [Bacteroidota bacterium]
MLKGVYGQHNAENLPKDQTIFDYMDRSAVLGDMRVAGKKYLGCFCLKYGDDVDKRIKVLSGGERSRCVLCTFIARANQYFDSR